MIKQGFIKKIGEPRTWKTQKGEERFTYPLTISIPYVRQDGKQGDDILIAEHTCANPDYVKRLEELRDNNTELDLTLSFSIRTAKDGREYNNVWLSYLSQRIS
jgi:hypothetical protein